MFYGKGLSILRNNVRIENNHMLYRGLIHTEGNFAV